jgi:hypothetical protein
MTGTATLTGCTQIQAAVEAVSLAAAQLHCVALEHKA